MLCYGRTVELPHIIENALQIKLVQALIFEATSTFRIAPLVFNMVIQLVLVKIT